MRIKLFNDANLQEKDISDKIIRVKAIMFNSKNEVLLGEAFGTLQFPGGHLENKEKLNEGLKREIKEETGIVLDGVYEPFFGIKYYLKDYPEKGRNCSLEIYYFYILTDVLYDLENIDLDSNERKGGFKLQYVALGDVKKMLKKNEKKNPVNKVINKEMCLALKELKKNGYKKV